jgi:23S rRNA pseudouridine1911/1915/1917 synthase
VQGQRPAPQAPKGRAPRLDAPERPALDDDGDDVFGWATDLEADDAPPPPETPRPTRPARPARPEKSAPAKTPPRISSRREPEAAAAPASKPERPARAPRADRGPQLSLLPNPRVPLRILHADPAFLVVHKPAGVVTQPGEGHTRDTLLNGLFATHGTVLQNIGKHRDFGLLHRLDRATSGLVVVALTAEAYDHLRAQFADRRIRKTYLALLHGAPYPLEGTERTPIWESREQGLKRARLGDHPAAQPAVTRYKTLIRTKGLSLVECHPETGRLHQIRAHMAHRGAPVVADDVYMGGRWDDVDHAFARLGGHPQFLHAARIELTHPTTGKRVTFTDPLPATWVAFLTAQGITCPKAWREDAAP